MSSIRKNKKRKFAPLDQQKQALNNLAVISEQDFIYEKQVINPQIKFFYNCQIDQTSFPKISSNFSEELIGSKIKPYKENSTQQNYKKNFSQSLIKKKTFHEQLINAFKNQQQLANRSHTSRFNKHCLGITNFMLFDSRCKSSENHIRTSSKVENDINKCKINHIKRVMHRKQKTSESPKSQKYSTSSQRLNLNYSKKCLNLTEVKVFQKIDDKLKQKFSKLSNLPPTLNQKAKMVQQKGKKIYIQLQNPIKLSKVQLHSYYKKYVL